MPIAIQQLTETPHPSSRAGSTSSQLRGVQSGYRPDIDGLRAVAVLSVLAFHLQWQRFSGGFAGVDVFFVISGYLISAGVLSEIDRDRFSLRKFYERRIRRIAPALLVMIAVTTLAGFRYLLPGELLAYARSLIATVLSYANIYFSRHSDYFSTPQASPLLHTWSLAVEEQCYLVLPLLLIAVGRYWRRGIRYFVFAALALSFSIGLFETSHHPATAFYLTPGRAWELLLGTLLACKPFPPRVPSFLRELAAVLGLAAILFAVFGFNSATPFPGVAALLPCTGSAMILWAGEAGSTFIGRLLALRPVAFVGLISYSLYLWHWPIIVFESMGVFYNGGSHLVNSLGVLAASFALATLSYKFVEQPFRNGTLKFSGAPLFGVAFASLAACAILGVCILNSGGFPARFPAQSVQVASYGLDSDNSSYRAGTCFLTPVLRHFDSDACLTMDTTRKNVLLIGDSHAAALRTGLEENFPDLNILQATSWGCRPFIAQSSDSDCGRLMDYMFTTWIPEHHIDALLVAYRWTDREIPGIAPLVSWAAARNLPIVLFGPNQEYDAPLPRLLAYSIADRNPRLIDQHSDMNQRPLDQKLRSLSQSQWHIHYVSQIHAACDALSCRQYADAAHNIPFLFDSHHLTSSGSVLMVRGMISSGELPSSIFVPPPHPKPIA